MKTHSTPPPDEAACLPASRLAPASLSLPMTNYQVGGSWYLPESLQQLLHLLVPLLQLARRRLQLASRLGREGEREGGAHHAAGQTDRQTDNRRQ